MLKRILKIFFQIFGVLLFTLVTAYALLAAYGYQIDLLERSITKTSIIDVNNKLDDVEIFYNGEFVANKAPYQIKKVEPGFHFIEVKKEGFFNWEKKIEVEEDFVAIINDILLIPENIEEIMRELKLEFTYSDVLFNDRYIVFIDNNESVFHVFYINDDGTFSIDHISHEIELSDIDIYFASINQIVITQEKSVIVVNLNNKNTERIRIPEKIYNLKLALGPNKIGFYTSGNELYSVKLNDENKFQIPTLLKSDLESENSDFEIYEKNGVLFILIEDDLYLFKNKEIEIIAENLNSPPAFSLNGEEIIYSTNNGEIIINNIRENEKVLLARLITDIQKVNFHYDQRHIYLKNLDSLDICDLEFLNCFKLLDIIENEEIIMPSYTTEFIQIDDKEFKVYQL